MARRELAAAVGLCLAGAALVLLAAGRAWTSVRLPAAPPFPAVRVDPAGRELTAAPAALGLVGLAGVVALAATRRSGRLLVGLLLLLAGVGVVVASVRVAADLGGAVAEVVAARTGATPARLPPMPATVWPWVSVVGGAMLAAAGLLTGVRGRRWAGLSARYDPPGGRSPAPPPDSATAAWDALDRGEDPTQPPPNPPPG